MARAPPCRAIAAVNHPHICHLYDVGPDYFVMEFVDGDPLRGPVSVDESLAVAAQILDALDVTPRDCSGRNERQTRKDAI